MHYRILTLLVVLAFAGRASAHALGVECKLQGDRVEVEAYYADDTPAGDARVRVLNVRRNEVANGRTDAQGRWSFPVPNPGPYEVVVNAGGGHSARVKMTIPTADGEESSGPVTVSEGPHREEFTRFPWLRVLLGLAVLAGLAIAFGLGRRRPQGATDEHG